MCGLHHVHTGPTQTHRITEGQKPGVRGKRERMGRELLRRDCARQQLLGLNLLRTQLGFVVTVGGILAGQAVHIISLLDELQENFLLVGRLLRLREGRRCKSLARG